MNEPLLNVTGLSKSFSAVQAVRGVVSLPHGVGRSVVVAAVSDDPAARDVAKAAGADVVGGEDLVDRVADGYVEFDACVATADMAPFGSLARAPDRKSVTCFIT